MKASAIDKLDLGLNKLIYAGMYVSSVAILLMTVFVCLASIGRYLTGTMILPGLFEMTGYWLMPLCVFPALSYGYSSGVFPFMENIIVKCPEKFSNIIILICLLFEIVMFGLVTYFTFEYALIGTVKNMQMRAGTELWPLYPFFYLAPYGFGLLTLKAFVAFLKLAKDKVYIIKPVQVE
ncbi:MAG: TRAP transporter small permease [Syntrophomonadaceae bacterium]